MALLARRLGLDPAELRLRNYVTADQMPYTTPPGAQYDSGDYPATLARALERFDYAGWRAEQARARGRGPAARHRHRHVGGAGGHQPRLLRAGDRAARRVGLGGGGDGPGGARTATCG